MAPPDPVIETAVALTRAIRRGTHPDPERLRERRECFLGRYGYGARVREEDPPVLVCYPAEWLDDSGTLRFDAIDSTDEAIERPLYGGSEDEWDAVVTHNYRLAERVGETHGSLQGENAHAFATYMANHHASRVEAATADQVQTFLEEYYPRNAWVSSDARTVLESSLMNLFAVAGARYPLAKED